MSVDETSLISRAMLRDQSSLSQHRKQLSAHLESMMDLYENRIAALIRINERLEAENAALRERVHGPNPVQLSAE
jgi:regulator of replication initiation timing